MPAWGIMSQALKPIIMIPLLILLVSPVIAIILFKLWFSWYNPTKIRQKYKGVANTTSQKKYPEADIYRFRSTFLQVGLLIALMFTIYAFNYTQAKEEVMALADFDIPEEIINLPPVTKQTPPPKPKTPPPPKIEVVEDEEIIEEPVDIFDAEAEESTEIVIDDSVFEEVLGDDTGDDEEEEEVVEEEEPEEPEIFQIVEEMPEFPGGQKALFKFLGANVKYPSMARENGISGTVYVSFVVEKNGAISNVKLRRGLAGGGAGCDDEALRVTKSMPNWKPGKQRGKAVRVAYTLPFKFLLN